MKYNIEKNEKRIKAMAPNTYEFVFIMVSLVCTCLGLDLGLELFTNVNCSIFLCFICYCVFWVIDALIFTCIKRKKLKIDTKEVVNEDK